MTNIVRQLFVIALLTCLSLSAWAGESVTYIHTDPLGSPVAATDKNGAVRWKESYRPYGERLLNRDQASHSVWFTGKSIEPQTGLSYSGQRYYDTTTGRFMAMDPVGFQDANLHSFNRYSYANNNPYRYVDPDGRYADLAIEAASITMGLVSLGENLRKGDFIQAAVDGLGVAADVGLAVVPGVPGAVGLGIGAARGVGKAVTAATELTAEQAKNIERFMSKVPANAKESLTLRALPNEGVAAQAVSPGRVIGSSAVYEKQIDATGKTIQYTKTTYDPVGNIVHVKDKISGGAFP